MEAGGRGFGDVGGYMFLEMFKIHRTERESGEKDAEGKEIFCVGGGEGRGWGVGGGFVA